MPTQQLEKPKSVGTAVTLLWASLGVGLVKMLLDLTHMSAMAPAAFTIFVLAFTFAILIFLIFMISAGRNWARITFLIMSVIGTVLTLPVVLDEFGRAPLVGVLSVLQILLQVYALFLLFTRSGNAWFRKAVPA